jgi:hypothetical protein
MMTERKEKSADELLLDYIRTIFQLQIHIHTIDNYQIIRYFSDFSTWRPFELAQV